jgi:hypothetical protein
MANRRVCDVIIDGGNGENVVCKEIVMKLGVKTEKHPSPYKIGWIKWKIETQVTERCHFMFSISKHYSNSILCDVVGDGCMPHNFGKTVAIRRGCTAQGEGGDNIYIIFEDGYKITFCPL